MGLKPPILDVLGTQGLPNPIPTPGSRLEGDLRRLEAYSRQLQRDIERRGPGIYTVSKLNRKSLNLEPGRIISLEDPEEDLDYGDVYPNPFERR